MSFALSLVIITKNEEMNIERCIKSAASFIDDIVVLDSGSTDRTCEIAEKLGARIFVDSWRGFGAQKNYASTLAKNDWIFSIDADEALSEKLINELKEKFPHLDPQKAYLLPRRSWYLGRWIDHGGWYPDYQLRLFHRNFFQWNLKEIHESVEELPLAFQEKASKKGLKSLDSSREEGGRDLVTFSSRSRREKFKAPLLHYVFKNLSHQVITNDRYSTLQARTHFEKAEGFYVWKLLIKPGVKFFETYIWKRGFLDGLPGFIIAVGAAYSVFIRWSKVWELEKFKQKN